MPRPLDLAFACLKLAKEGPASRSKTPVQSSQNPQPHGGSMDTVAHRNVHRTEAGAPAASLPLSSDHLWMLEVESSISREYIAGRGYFSASRRADVPNAFKGRQRRLGLVIPTYSPSGATGFRLRPNNPISPGRKYEQPYGVVSALDVHPFNLERVQDHQVELWVTEGEKTADCLASRGECVLSIPGVHNFAAKGTAGAEGLPCWEHVPLHGRTVTVVYDADARTNASVQLALKRLVALLENRGADVYVVYLPGVSDA